MKWQTVRKIFKMTLIVIGSIIGVVLVVGLLFLNLSPQFGAKTKGERAARIQQSPNFRDGEFRNVQETTLMHNFEFSSITGYFTTGDKAPDWSIPVDKIPSNYFADVPDTLTRLTWFGHSAALLEIDGKKIFLDPMLASVPAPHPWLGSKRFNDTLPLAVDQLPELDAVLISHDHYDHLSYESIVAIKDRVKRFYVPLGIAAHLLSWGVAEDKIVELDWWDEATLEGITFACTPSRHFSGRGVLDGCSTLWCSWVIRGSNASIFFGGDSGYDKAFGEIGKKYGPFDLAMLECGQYNRQWPEIHMMPEETVQANIDLNSKLLMPIHWGAFKLALHSWTEPAERVSKKARELNVAITTPRIGQPIVIGQPAPASAWWEG